MNRWLAIPAACSVVGFVALLSILQGATGQDRTTITEESPALYAVARVDGEELLSVDEAKRSLTALAEQYTLPWREYAKSPRRLYSRVGPRPIPTILAKVDESEIDASGDDGFLVATISISKGQETQVFPCVIDRVTSRARLFVDGAWIGQRTWLEQAPLP